MVDNIKAISHLIEEQFPERFRRDGENLVKFVEAYYEWMEQTGLVINESMSLPEYVDIDTTLDTFLDHFVNTYMVGLPNPLLGNQKLLQKHILDLYRSKNSKTSIELLFRLLYNSDIELYLPSDDILRVSDGTYERRAYIEVDYSPNFSDFNDKNIYGVASGATATVAATERRTIKNKPRLILYLEDVKGKFIFPENVYYNEERDHEPLRIIGSIRSMEIQYSTAGWQVGEEVYIDETMSPTVGEGFSGYVSEVYDSDVGMIFPVLVDGGTGYAMDSVITVEDDQNTMGEDAAFAVGALSNTSVITFTNYTVGDFMGVPIDAPDYSVYGIGVNTGDFIPNLYADIDYTLNYLALTVGTISAIRIIHPGQNYDGPVKITAFEERTNRLGLPEYSGNNAIIDNYAAFGTDLIGEITIRESGFGYQGQSENGILRIRDTDNIKFAAGNFRFGEMGQGLGRYTSDRGWPSSTKRLQDSYYYQQFSYEIQAKQSLREYGTIVKAVVHPAGNEMFGSVRVSDIDNKTFKLQEKITIT